MVCGGCCDLYGMPRIALGQQGLICVRPRSLNASLLEDLTFGEALIRYFMSVSFWELRRIWLVRLRGLTIIMILSRADVERSMTGSVILRKSNYLLYKPRISVHRQQWNCWTSTRLITYISKGDSRGVWAMAFQQVKHTVIG